VIESFINVTSAGAGRACVELHHDGEVIDISNLVTSATWTMAGGDPAKLTLVVMDSGRVELEAAVPEGLTVRFENRWERDESGGPAEPGRGLSPAPT
jgi:hypothetical protein